MVVVVYVDIDDDDCGFVVVSAAGRAFCGKRMVVDEGDALVGNMTLVNTRDDGSQKWLVEAIREKVRGSHSYRKFG